MPETVHKLTPPAQVERVRVASPYSRYASWSLSLAPREASSKTFPASQVATLLRVKFFHLPAEVVQVQDETQGDAKTSSL